MTLWTASLLLRVSWLLTEKSEALEVKDIILHLERAWDMVLPGFEGDDLKVHKLVRFDFGDACPLNLSHC